MNPTLPSPDEFGIPLFLRRGYKAPAEDKGDEAVADMSTPVIPIQKPLMADKPYDIENDTRIPMFLRRKKSPKAEPKGGSSGQTQSNGENG